MFLWFVNFKGRERRELFRRFKGRLWLWCMQVLSREVDWTCTWDELLYSDFARRCLRLSLGISEDCWSLIVSLMWYYGGFWVFICQSIYRFMLASCWFLEPSLNAQRAKKVLGLWWQLIALSIVCKSHQVLLCLDCWIQRFHFHHPRKDLISCKQ